MATTFLSRSLLLRESRTALRPCPSILRTLQRNSPISKPPHSHSQTSRHASSSSKKAPSKGDPNILEKPERFNPPSHPQRLSKKPPRSYPGPPLSAQDVERQNTKKYPHSMPPEGSFSHWFLTNRSIHIYITLGTLFSLAFFTTFTNFRRTTPFADMLPPTSDIFYHPISFTSRYLEIFKLHIAHTSAETAEKRRKNVDDAMKRKQYRKAHGEEADLEGGGGVVGGWFAKFGNKKETEETDDGVMVQGMEAETGPAAGSAAVAGGIPDEAEELEQPQERRKKPRVKRWFGIWE
ncbi:MAG: iso-1-cytochrome c [Chaenotheca gracillima]|nr:MAG: iso-1-cytochrome c [Chaenotheca gracillima]